MISLGVDAWNLPGDHRGIGRYLRAILRQWQQWARERVQMTLIVPEWHTWTVRRRYLREVDGGPYRLVSRKFHSHAGLDALWFPFNGCSWTNFSLPAAATLHDASNFVVPEYAPATQEIFRAAAQRCSALITDSSFAQHELARELSIVPERLIPIPLGVDPPRPAARIALDVTALQPYVLYVGAAEARKGFDVLLAAMSRIAGRRANLRLVATTRLGDWTVGGAHVVDLGYVDDNTLAALYRAAKMLVFPSRYEGFGLPVLEAMSYATPVIASSTPAVTEAGGDAACYVEPGDDAGLAEAILRVARDEAYANDLRRRGLIRAAEFTWRRTAERTLDVIESMVAATTPPGFPPDR